jgi:nucleotidyltransferase/DNA polymerase involved in DNA repair
MKPPKSWLAEYASNHGNNNNQDDQSSNKRKNGSIGSNMDDSFRTYMAHKINLQREQFGLVLPPPDPIIQDVGKVNDGIKSAKSHTINNPKPRKIRFNIADDSPTKEKCDQSSSQNMDSVLNRLKNKHRRGGNLKRRKKKRRTSSSRVSKQENRSSQNSQNSSSPSFNETVESPAPDDKRIELECKHDSFSASSTCNTLTSQQSPSQTPSPSVQSMLQLKRQRKDLFFLGTTVLVNGYTNPSSDTIMRLLHKYGGNLEKYETACVTHIIAESLSTAKAKIYKRQKKPIPVVRPEWIVDCVEAGRLVPFADYLLEEVREENVCASVKSFFQKKEAEDVLDTRDAIEVEHLLDTRSIDSDQEVVFPEKGSISAELNGNLDSVKHSKAFTLYQEVEDKGSPSVGNDSSKHSPSRLEVFEPQQASSMYPSTQNFHTGANSNVSTPIRLPSKLRVVAKSELYEEKKDKLVILDSPEYSESSSPAKRTPSADKLAHNEFADIPKKKNRSPSKRQRFSGGMRTVGTDPNFLESYFSKSRLSFIGSFKQRLGKSKGPQRQAAHSADAKRFVLHIDMDCFFAAIAVRNFPQFRDKPVAVGHAWKNDPNGIRGDSIPVSATDEKKKSYSELSTCNYKARKFGVKKGMFLHRARQLCPDLVVLPYDYEGYEDASNKVGEILRSVVDEYNGAIEQVSCDESYIEFYLQDGKVTDTDTDSEPLRPMLANDLARSIGDSIRRAIVDKTKCTASIGVGPNKLLAKLATDSAKDGGGDRVAVVVDWKTFLNGTHLREIPGIGYRMEEKLQSYNLTQVQDVWGVSEGELIKILGPGNGSKIYKFCHGEDSRPVQPAERKTIGAECNYGVRFDGPYGVDCMMKGLAAEVEKRMTNVQVLGKHLTVKVKERRAGAGPPGKVNGHGKCNDHSKSSILPGHHPTRGATIIAREAMQLFEEMGIDKNEIRGMGIVISKLENEDDSDHEGLKSSDMASWLQSSINMHSPQNKKPVKERDDIIDVEEQNSAQIPESACTDKIEPCDKKNAVSTTAFDSEANSMDMKAKRPTSTAQKGRTPLTMRSHTRELKSFFKLAEIKSGEKKLSYDGEQVSLTQLDSLPLEIQLQVANNDDSADQIIRRPPPKVSKPARHSSYEEGSTDQIMLRPTPKVSKPAKHDRNDYGIIEIDVNEKDSVHSIPSEDSVHDEDEELTNDVTVLREWMDEHKNPSAEDVELVRDFLCICVSEKRLDDVVSFLRLVKIREDAWNSEYYQDLVKSTEQFILNFEGRKLDLSGLGL